MAKGYGEEGVGGSGLARFQRKGVAVAIGIVAAIVLTWAAFNVFEYLDATDLMVIQSPISGELTWNTTPGVKYQGFGAVTKYKKRDQFWFSAQSDQGKKIDESIKIRFNDGGHGKISGSIAWEMPLDNKNLTAIHVKYGSHHAVQQQLVRTIIEKAVYMTGPLMSSTESYSEKRNELLSLIEDQVQRGVYKTETSQERKPDPMTSIIKTVNVVKLVFDDKKLPIRAESSPLQDFGIKTFNLSINEVAYDKEVESQIQQQQKAIMQVQIAVAKAKESEQEAISVAKKGEADAAKSKWEQEVIKAKLVTEAQQKLQVAELAAKEAAQYKQAEILKGEGEATRKRLVMEADGALEKKLEAYVATNKIYADAIKGYTGNWVPNVVMGGGASQVAGSGAQQLIDLLTAKTAKDLGLDMSMPGASKTKGGK